MPENCSTRLSFTLNDLHPCLKFIVRHSLHLQIIILVIDICLVLYLTEGFPVLCKILWVVFGVIDHVILIKIVLLFFICLCSSSIVGPGEDLIIFLVMSFVEIMENLSIWQPYKFSVFESNLG